METTKVGPLRVRVVRSAAPKAEKDSANTDAGPPLTVVLMHGFGAPGDDLVGLSDMIQAPAGTTFVFPEAPHALRDLLGSPLYGDARAWWLIDVAKLERALATGELRDLSREVPAGLEAARDDVVAMLDALGAIAPLERLVLGGFSQGAMLALDVALRTDRELAGLVLLSGTMIAEHEWTPRMPERASVPVFQSHGDADAILPYVIAERLRDALRGAGLEVTFDRFEGPHTIPASTGRALGEWLALKTRPRAPLPLRA